MIKDTIQIPVAAALFLTLFFILFIYVKPRRNRPEFIIELLNELGGKNRLRERHICRKKRKY